MQDAEPLELDPTFQDQATELLDPRRALSEDIVDEREIGIRPGSEDVLDLAIGSEIPLIKERAN